MINSTLANPYRIVVDTNLWISFLIGKRLSILLDVLDSPWFELVITAQLHREIMSVAKRPKFQKYFGETQIDALEYWLSQKAITIEIGEVQPRCRDAKDDYLLQLAVEAKAIYLVSGDDDLLSLGEVEGCQIMTVAQFQILASQMGFVG